MDVAKYIGLFLLKNQFCYIHGLGNLEIKKRPASYDGTALQPPLYEITVTPTGSIDDNLANFIATNEQISISKAANALRDYSTQARADLQAGNDVVIPHLGKFSEENGKVHFITDPHFQYTPPGIPSLRVSKRVEEQPFQAAPKPVIEPKTEYTRSGEPVVKSSLNWGRVILAAIVLALIIAACILGVKYYRNHANNSATAAMAINDTTLHQPRVDAEQVRRDSAAAAAIHADSVQSFDMIVNTYATKFKADRRVSFLKSIGHPDMQVVQDSDVYLVILPVKCKAADTTHLKDSLKVIYNPEGVTIFR